jgi:hypothetical protein
LGVGVGRPQDSCEATLLLLLLESEPLLFLATEIQPTEIQASTSDIGEDAQDGQGPWSFTS